MKKNLIVHKQEIMDEMTNALRELFEPALAESVFSEKKGVIPDESVFVGVDEHGAYHYAKATKNAKNGNVDWYEEDIACLSPLPGDFRIPGNALTALLEKANIKIEPPISTGLSVLELREKFPDLHTQIFDEIFRLCAEEEQIERLFEGILLSRAQREGYTLRDLSEAVLDSSKYQEDGANAVDSIASGSKAPGQKFGLILAFLIQGAYLKSGISLDSISFETPLAEICRAVPGRNEYREWESSLAKKSWTQESRTL